MAIRTHRSFLAAAALLALTAGTASAQTLYSNGFETDLADSPSTSWSGGGVARVASGTNGITSASGSFHAVSTSTGAFGRWGGYNYGAGNAVPTAFQEYRTSVDIYLNVGGGWANNTRFDFSSAINNSGGTHLRDFIFNGGYYTADALAGGAPAFIFSGSNTSQPGSAYPQNPARSPIAISTTGWYTFSHHFYNNGGVLEVAMTISDTSNSVLGTWTLSNPLDLIGGVGGNRYGWFDYQQFGGQGLAFDNASLTLVPTPAAGALLGLGGLLATRRRR